jgi:hypothetical protein
MSLFDAIDSLGTPRQVTRGTTTFSIIAIAEPMEGGHKIRTRTALQPGDVVDLDGRRWTIITASPWKFDGETLYECDAIGGH